MPDVVAKVIEISEYYEKDKCDEVHKNTLLLKQMHKNLTEKSNQLDFKAPDLGFMDFFKDFESKYSDKSYIINIYCFYYKSNIKFIQSTIQC